MDPIAIQAALDRATHCHQIGDLRQAEQLYRQILQQQPDHAGAWHLLGVLAYQSGHAAAAVDLIGRALTCNPGFAEAYCNLALALHDLGRNAEAIAACRQAIALQPGLAAAHNNLGRALLSQGQLDQAVDAFRQALALQPQFFEALNNLGSALLEQRRSEEALAAFQQASALQPAHAGTWRNLGLARREKKQYDAARAAFRQAITLQPRYADAYISLGKACQEEGRSEEAIAAFQQAIAFKPDLALAHYNLACVLRECGRLDMAITACRQALALQPDYVDAWACLGWALWDRGTLDDALAAFRRALALRPDDVNIYCQIGAILKGQGLLDQAADVFRAAMARVPAFAPAHSNLLITMLYNPACDGQAIAEEHQRWNALHAAPLAVHPQPYHLDRSLDRRLRVGFVSPDFRDHVIGRNLVPLFRHRDPDQWEAVCYANHLPSDARDDNPGPGAPADAITEEFRRHATEFHGVSNMDDGALAQRIREDRIDILVDLTLHLGGGRLLVFARRPAPVQVTFAGYPGTSGLGAIDYRLSDPHLDPPDREEGFYSETTWRLPASFWCYDPLDVAPPAVGPLSALVSGQVTFGCLNNFCKINQGVLTLWARVLTAVPGARLVLLTEEGSHRGRTTDFLEAHGIDRSRVTFFSKRPRREYLQLYQQIDIGLDTLPYNGHTTSLDSLFMGVPVVTRVGDTIVGRAGLSQLTNLGLPELITWTDDQFVTTACAWATDLPRLAALRAGLRQRMMASPLMDGPAFARGIETVFHAMWRRWCQTAS